VEAGSWNPDEQRKEVRESSYVPIGSVHQSLVGEKMSLDICTAVFKKKHLESEGELRESCVENRQPRREHRAAPLNFRSRKGERRDKTRESP